MKLLENIPPHEIILFRCLISFLLCAITIKRMKIPFFGNNIPWLVVRGLFGCIALVLFFITLKNIHMATAVTIQYVSPIFTVIFAIYIVKEKVRKIQWLLFGVAFIGVVMLKGFSGEVQTLYLILGLFSALLSGIAYNAIMKCRNTEATVSVVLYFFFDGDSHYGHLVLF